MKSITQKAERKQATEEKNLAKNKVKVVLYAIKYGKQNIDIIPLKLNIALNF